MDNALDVPGRGTGLHVREADVFGGNTDLRLRVVSIADGKLAHRPAERVPVEGVALDDDGSDRGDGTALERPAEWVTVEGEALNEDGSDRGYRSALVRLSALLGQDPATDGPIRPDVVADPLDSRAKRF